MEFTFLGTSAGIPTRQRNVSALALRPDQSRTWALFDCGEGTQHQLLHSNLSPFRLEQIFITHLHGDHIYGIFGLLASRGMMMCESPLTLYGPPGSKKMIRTVQRYTQLNLPYPLEIIELEPDAVFPFAGGMMNVLPLSHSIPSYGYCWIENDRPGQFDPVHACELGIKEGPLYGKLQRGEIVTVKGRTITPDMVMGPKRPGRRFAVAGDNDRPELFTKYAPFDLLIHEATYLQNDFDRLPRKFKHTTALQLGRAASEMEIVHLAATHFSPRYVKEEHMEEIRREIRKNYSGFLTLAEDFTRIVL